MFRKLVCLISCLALTLTFTACGGGGGGGTNDGIVSIWGDYEFIETNNGNASAPQIVFNGKGTAIAVWSQHDGTRTNIWSNTYSDIGAVWWGNAELIETDNNGSAYDPQIATDGAGNAIAVWIQDDGTSYRTWANYYTDGTGWGSDKIISFGPALSARIAFDSNGNAIALWTESGGGVYHIMAKKYTAGVGWEAGVTQTHVSQNYSPSNVSSPSISFDGSGNAVALWRQDDGSGYKIKSSTYTATTDSWSAPVFVETTGVSNNPEIVFYDSSSAVAVWEQNDGTRTSIWSRPYSTGSGWGVSSLVELADNEDAISPKITFDGSGNAVAIWTQNDGTVNNLWAATYATSSGWTSAKLIESESGSVSTHNISSDGNGFIIAVWTQDYGSVSNVWAKAYSSATGWSVTSIVESSDSGDAFSPQVAIDSLKHALIVSGKNDGTENNIISIGKYF